MNLSPSFQLGKSWLWHALFFGLLLLIQVSLALFREQPLRMSDEAVFLANALYLSGSGPMPTLHGAHYSAFGYSLFLVPAYWIFDHPNTIYTACLIISAFLLSTLYFGLYYVLKSLLGTPSRPAALAAFLTCLYPPILLRANFAWADAAYLPGFVFLVALFSVLLRQKSVRSSIVFGLLLGFMYTIHSRSLPLIPVAVFYLVVLGLFRSLPWRTVSAALAATGLIFIGTRLAIDHLRMASGAAIPQNPVGPVFTHFLSAQGFLEIVAKANEYVLYLVQTSFGLFPVGALAVGYVLWQRRSTGLRSLAEDVPSATITFFLLAWLGTLALGAAFIASGKDQAQFLIGGRYIDGVSAIFFGLGLVTILRGMQLWTWRVAAFAVLSLAGMTLAAYFSPTLILTSVFEASAYPFLRVFGATPLAMVVASAVAAVGFVFFSLARGRLRFAAVTIIACFFLLTTAFGYFFAILPLQDRVARSSSLASYIRAYLGSPPAIAYDTASYHPLSYFSYEFLLPHSRFLPFNSAMGELPPAPIVISSRSWSDAATLGAHFWQSEPHVPLVGADQALWTLPGPQQSDLLQHVDYTNTVLGGPLLPAWGIDTPQGRPVQTVWAVWQRSFYHPEITTIETSLVWFDADATLRIPYGTRPPQAILLNFINPAGEEKPLQIDVNGESIFAGAIPSGNWCEAFPLPVGSGGSVNVELSRPTRELLLVRGITLLDHVPDMQLRDITTGPLPASGYRSQLALESPLYPQTLARNTMGTVRLSVTNTSDQIWPTSCEIGNSPGAVQLGILWFRKHSGDRRLSDRIAEGRAALPYGLAPGRSLTLTVILAPVKQDGEPLPPGEYEVWIGPVQEGVTWFFQEGDDVLTLPVRIVR